MPVLPVYAVLTNICACCTLPMLYFPIHTERARRCKSVTDVVPNKAIRCLDNDDEDDDKNYEKDDSEGRQWSCCIVTQENLE